MASTFRVLNCPTGTWTADVFASTDLSTATDTGVSLSQSAAGIVTGSVSRTGLHMVRLFRNAVRYGETWGNLVDGATVDCDESKMLAAAGLASYLPVTTTRMDISAGGLVRFVTDDTGETSAAAGSVAKLAQGGGSGTGAYTLTITVNDGTDELENATVRLTEGVNSYTATTDADGEAVFALDAATYSVAITKTGYEFTPTTKVVSATGTQTYSMTAMSVTPSDPPQTTAYVTIYTAGHTAVQDAVVEIQILKLANGTTGSGIDDPLISGTTDANGYVQFTGLPRGATYQVRVDGGPWSRGVTASASTTALAGVLGLAE